jgi:NAD(P)-dependent dehydrogenase (short-subunit alcohol dehydrogenase family)
MHLQLEDRVILVVGGHGYLGRTIVSVLQGEGAIAVPASRRAPDGIVMDAADEGSVTAGVARILDEHGRLDGVVGTAAPSASTLDPSRDTDPAQVLAAVDGKALTFLRIANATLPHMVDAGFGRLVGIAGQKAYQSGSVTASVRNAALLIAAKNLADSTAGSGVTVNTINPGPVLDEPTGEVPAGEPGPSSPLDIARLAAFLLSPLTGAISGESISIGHRLRGSVVY